VRIMNLRRADAPRAPSVEARASAGAELLRLIGVLISSAPEDFDVGTERIASVRDRVPEELLAAAKTLGRATRDTDEDLRPGDDKAFLVLALLGALAPEPGGVEQLTAHLRADLGLPWRMLVAHHAQPLLPDATPLFLAGILAGDEAAIARLREIAAEHDDPLSDLLAWEPDAFGRRLLEIFDGFAAEVWGDLHAEAMGPIERDVAHRQQQLDQGLDPAKVVLEATNGIELTEEPSVSRVILLPSYWFRPWLVVGYLEGLDLEVISTSVADEFLALPSEAPPPALLKLFKALSDEGRLKLLRRMSAGPISLGEATAELDVTKATAHHHLSILRQAGLVSIRGEGRSTRYTLREEPTTVATEALAAYVPPRG
jgi:DNA-binding transcriptional ArsR family regulator